MNMNFQSGAWETLFLKAIQETLISQVQEPPAFRGKSKLCPWPDTTTPSFIPQHMPRSSNTDPALVCLPAHAEYYLSASKVLLPLSAWENLIQPSKILFKHHLVSYSSVNIDKLGKLYTFSMCCPLHTNYTSIKLWNLLRSYYTWALPGSEQSIEIQRSVTHADSAAFSELPGH